MSAQLIATSRTCRRCSASLTLEEMHYFEAEDGSATCSLCEQQWMDDVAAWRRGDLPDLPDPNK